MGVVAFLTIDIMSEDRDHVLVRVGVEVMDLVPFVDDVGHHIRRWCVDNRR